MSFDPYAQWLGIPPHEQPPDHYRLLGLSRFESNRATIEAAAEQVMAHVRSFQTGPRARYTQKLLNEIATAKIQLLNPVTKAQYDAALDASLSSSQAFSADILPPSITGDPPQGDPPPVTETATIPASTSPIPIVPRPISVAARVRRQRRVGFLLGLVLVLAILSTAGVAVVINRLAKRPPPQRITEHQLREDPVSSEPESAGPVVLLQEANGDVNFPAAAAVLSGQLKLDTAGSADVIRGWSSEEDAAEWRFRVVKLPSQGIFQLRIAYETAAAAQGFRYVVAIGDADRSHEVRSANGIARDEFYFAVSSGGEHTLTLQIQGKPATAEFTLHSLELTYPRRGRGN